MADDFCQSVYFSDLNRTVLEESTWPNIYLNCPDKLHKVKCFSGDWDDLISLFKSDINNLHNQFDLILSSETIYSVDICKKVPNVYS